MSRDDLVRMILIELEKQSEAARSRPRPPAWQWWAVRDYELDLEFGPRYSPTWFGEVATTEARRVRALRGIYRLEAAGLLEIFKSEGGRLERVRLTPAGSEAVAELRAAAVPAGS